MRTNHNSVNESLVILKLRVIVKKTCIQFLPTKIMMKLFDPNILYSFCNSKRKKTKD